MENVHNKATSNNKILIIDDQSENMQILSEILAPKKYHIYQAIDGKTALASTENLLPDLILLDINMPDVDGYEVCRQLKQQPLTKDIPVIFISAFNEGVNKIKAFQCGGADYISKPFQVEEVLVRVENQLIIQWQKKALRQTIKNLEQNHQVINEYLEQVQLITRAAKAVEDNTFTPHLLKKVSRDPGELGTLARVFLNMVETVQKREQEIASAKDQLTAVLNAVPGTISWISSDGTYLGINKHLANSLNVEPEIFVGKKIGFLSNNPEFVDFMLQFVTGDRQSVKEEICLQVNETNRYYLMAAEKYQQGQASVIVGIDVTERRHVQDALRITEENYRSIFENALEGIYQSSPDGYYINVNPAMAKIYGYDSPASLLEEVKYIRQQVYVHAADRDRFTNLMATQGFVSGLEYEAYRQDGTIIWVAENARAVRNQLDELLYYEGIIQDITKRKEEETELKRQLAELKIEIDQKKRASDVAQITQSEYFQNIQSMAEVLRFDDNWLD